MKKLFALLLVLTMALRAGAGDHHLLAHLWRCGNPGD